MILMKNNAFWESNFENLFWGSNFKNVFYTMAILKMYFWGSNFKNVFFKMATLKIYFLRKQHWKCVFWGSNFEWVILFWYTLYNILSFFNKIHLTFVCNFCSENRSLKIKKVSSKTGSLHNSSHNIKIICITQQIWEEKDL